MKFFFLSLFIHASLFLVISVQNEHLSKDITPKVDSNDQVMHISIKLNQEDIEVWKTALNKIERSKAVPKIKKPKLSNKNIKNNTETIKKVAKVEGTKKLEAYFLELRNFIENKKYYPKKAIRMRQSGVVEVCLEIDSHGHFHAIKIKKPSEFQSLNNAALGLINRISRFKPLPKSLGEKITLNIPLKYALNL